METEDKLIRLLIVDEGLHKAEQLTSSLRATGMHVRAEFAEDSEDMCDILENKTLDLVLFSTDLPEIDLSQARHLISECGRHVGLIAIAQKVDTEIIVKAMDEGAQDVVTANSLEHLIQVIKRESNNINIWRRAKRLELDFQESEKRCQNLLANSKDAVAYVHEGMHIFANEVYMENLAQNDENQESIRELANQAVGMKINTITPGVMDAAVLSVLWTLDVDFVQGDFLQPAQKDLSYDFSSM